MKVMLIHNYYGFSAPSGENKVFEVERDMLLAAGHDVEVVTRHSDEIRGRKVLGKVQGAVLTPWNPMMYRHVKRAVERVRPDVVHVHNTFPIISPSVFHAVRGRAARVLTLHNYRLFCSAAIPLRKGEICTECLEKKSAWPAIRYGCYRRSRLATAPLALSIELHRRIGTWDRQVEAFIALTEFQRAQMIGAGLRPERIWIKPNFYPGSANVMPWLDRNERVVYVGRISIEKGVVDLVDAWLAWGKAAPELVFVGDGPLRPELQNRVLAASASNIRFIGHVEQEEAQRWIASSRLLILPSIWFETFGLVLLEAFAHGTPVAVSLLGSLTDIVVHRGCGFGFRPGDSDDLRTSVAALWSNQSRLQDMGGKAREEFDAKYSEDANYKQLMRIYDESIAITRSKV